LVELDIGIESSVDTVIGEEEGRFDGAGVTGKPYPNKKIE
jgi:hypothetical protein